MEYLLEILKNVPDDESRKDYNLIVYLLKYTDCLTAKGRSLAKDIHYEDIKLNENDSRYENIAIQNKIRYLIYKNNFSQALGEMDRHIKKEDITPLESFVRNCLIKIIHCLQVREIKIYQCIVSKNYEELEKYLYFLYRNGIAVYYYSYILKISRKIREITETGIVPLEKEADYQTIYDAINNEDYPKALAMFEKFKPDENQKCNGLIKMLLIDITNLIKKSEDILDTSNAMIVHDLIKLEGDKVRNIKENGASE